MTIRIDNERQLNVAKDFVNFIKEHNKRAIATAGDNTYDLLVRQASLINSMANSLAVKQTEVVELKAELNELRSKIDELEQEIRVSKDLLTIASAIKE